MEGNNPKQHGILLIFVLMVLAVIFGGTIVAVTEGEIQRVRRKKYMQKNPNAPVQIPLAVTVPAAMHPDATKTGVQSDGNGGYFLTTPSGATVKCDANGNLI